MASPKFELQLGHLCNNRCVFCISGFRTSKGMVSLLPIEALWAEVEAAHRRGSRSITFLGGEPTVQPSFLELLRRTAALGFDEIVLFTNGSRLYRPELMDRVAAIDPRIEFRFSFQGATREAHERTTRRRGSFAQIVSALELARARGRRVTVNICVVRQNYESLPRFAELLESRGVSHLHLDMLHPRDTPDLPAGEIEAIIPRYTDLVEPLRQMRAAFSDAFPVGIGNLPFCVAPDLADRIRHGGEGTNTITVNDEGRAEVGGSWDKYERKGGQKLKTDGCRSCVFTARCSGIFGAYAEIYGLEEFVPVGLPALRRLDPERRLFLDHLRGALLGLAPPPALGAMQLEAASDHALDARFSRDGRPLGSLRISRSGPGHAAGDWFVLGDLESWSCPEEGLEALRFLYDALLARGGGVGLHPPGDDALAPLRPSLADRVRRLRQGAPHGELAFLSLERPSADRVEALFEAASGLQILLWFEDREGRRRAGYEARGLAPGSRPPQGVVDSIRDLLRVCGLLEAAPSPRLAPPGAPREV